MFKLNNSNLGFLPFTDIYFRQTDDLGDGKHLVCFYGKMVYIWNMDIHDKLFLLVLVMMVTIYVMGLFIWKYYDSFEFKDKLIIGCLRIIFMIGVLVYLCFNYSGINSFFLAWFPFLIIGGIYKLIRQYQLKGDEFLINDKITFIYFEILAYVAMALYFGFIEKGGFRLLMVAITAICIVYCLKRLMKLYRSEPKAEG